MGDLTILHKTARSLILSLRDGIEKLEKSENVTYGRPPSLARDLEKKLADLQRTSQSMDNTWRMHVMREGGAKRDIWKRKVEQVAEEVDALRAALEKHSSRECRRQAEEQQRSELLARRTGGADPFQTEEEAEAQTMGRVQNSRRLVEDSLQAGMSILTNMTGQRESIKAAQRKALDVLNTLGLSDSLLRLIERRQRLDAWIVYGGMLLVFIFMVALWLWLR